VGEDADRGTAVHLGALQVAVRPLDHDLVRVREACRGGEDRAGVAHGDPVAEEAAGLAERGGEVDRAEDQHAGAGRGHVDEDGEPVGAGVPVPAERDECGASRPQLGCGPVRHRLACWACGQRPVGDPSVAENAQGGADQFVGPVDDLCHGGGSAPGNLGEGRAEVRPGRGVDALDEDVEFAAAGQAHGEGVVIGIAEPGAPGRALVVEHLTAQFVDLPLDAAAGDAADGVAVLVHRDRRTDGQGRASGDIDDGGQGEGACLAAPAAQCVRDVQHGSFSGFAVRRVGRGAATRGR
jgi:hypothetical protein